MDKKEFSVLIQYRFLKGKNTVETKTWLDAVLPDTAPGRLSIKDCYAKFRLGEMSSEDGERNLHPKEGGKDETLYKIHKMILNGRKLKVNEITDILNISTERVNHMIHEYFGMRKLCAKWVPRELTFDQKQRRVDDSKQCLEMIKLNKPVFLHRYVAIDET
ncbi:hypothetical protein GWI33_018750 [Rhynchophorus ferrugineus]|uniref:Histone-lysine N-methyltransferase SETMAR n=1 Tax=Rhynchophorus ferrugineus TaxID=354439 RepID=A0A834HUB2_RHYFE|nr:hypothetical protein GWI33_018750 [Rhynchophorus ferrugineus]